MNDFSQLIVMAKYQFRNYLRSKRLLILFIITFAIAILYLVVIAIYVNPEDMKVKDFSSNWSSPISFLVILASLFFGGDAIAGEYQSKTGYFLFPNPIKRIIILWGKFLASFLASLIVVLSYWAVSLIAIFYYYSEIPDVVWYSISLSLLFLVSLLSLTYLFSSLFKNGAIAITIVAIIYFFVFRIVDSISMLSGIEPWFSITYGASVITLVFQGDYMGDYAHKQILHVGRHMSFTTYNPYMWEGIAIMVLYFVISAILATLLLHYKEMK